MQRSRRSGQASTPTSSTSIGSFGQIHTTRQEEARTDALAKGPHAEGKRKRKRRLDTFPTRLHTLLDDNVVAHRFFQHLISWRPHGRCFQVHNTTDFEREIMPVVFKQTKWSSFQRQLNLYGFQRLSHGRDKGCYWNEFFLRGKPELCEKVIRTKVKGTKVRAACDPTLEPNFCTMVVMPPAPRNLCMLRLAEPSMISHANHSLHSVNANLSAQSKTLQQTSQYEGFVAQQTSPICSSRNLSTSYSNCCLTTHITLGAEMMLKVQPDNRDCFTAPAVFLSGAPISSGSPSLDVGSTPLDHQGLLHNTLIDIDFLMTQEPCHIDDDDDERLSPTFWSQHCNIFDRSSTWTPPRATATVPVVSCFQRDQQWSTLPSHNATYSTTPHPQYHFSQNGLIWPSSMDISPQKNDAWGDLFEMIHK
jgi:HSF-type DNA-binding